MSTSKKLVVNLSKTISETLNEEFNDALKEDKTRKSDFLKNAIVMYMEEKRKNKKNNLLDMMKQGYSEMGNLNLQLAEDGMEFEIDRLVDYEATISESDIESGSDTEKRRYILC